MPDRAVRQKLHGFPHIELEKQNIRFSGPVKAAMGKRSNGFVLCPNLVFSELPGNPGRDAIDRQPYGQYQG